MTWLALRALLGRVPKQVWLVLAVVALLAVGVLWHGHKVHQTIAAAEKRGADAEAKRIEAKALELKRKADALNAKISAELRSRSDEEARRIAASADTLRLSGPGLARCPRNPGVPAGPGKPVAATGRPDAAGSEMPSGDSAAVPWGWLVGRAEQCDLNRSEVLTWREWYDRTVAGWPK